MARLIYFRTDFPPYHPKAGQETHFIEGIWISLLWLGIDPTPPWDLLRKKEEQYFDAVVYNKSYEKAKQYEQAVKNLRSRFSRFKETAACVKKVHTIRGEGRIFNVGDLFKPVFWSGRPYWSYPVQFAPDIKVLETQNFTLCNGFYECGAYSFKAGDDNASLYIARNDGFAISEDMNNWFSLSPEYKKKKVFQGQLIAWHEVGYDIPF